MEEPFLDFIKLYLSLDNLSQMFNSENFLLVFWIHFLALNIFLGSWVSRDAFKYNISRSLVAIPILLIFFTGPVGLVLYWFIRVFFARKLGFHD